MVLTRDLGVGKDFCEASVALDLEGQLKAHLGKREN